MSSEFFLEFWKHFIIFRESFKLRQLLSNLANFYKSEVFITHLKNCNCFNGTHFRYIKDFWAILLAISGVHCHLFIVRWGSRWLAHEISFYRITLAESKVQWKYLVKSYGYEIHVWLQKGLKLHTLLFACTY